MKYLLIAIVSVGALWACQKDEADKTAPHHIEKDVAIRYSPDSAEWFNRGNQDSLEIDIKGGVPPYEIYLRPMFSADARIDGSTLIIYPKELRADSIGSDKLGIRDAEMQERDFPILVKSQFYDYTEVAQFQLEISGDTTFSMDSIAPEHYYWDEFEGNFTLLGSYLDQEFYLVIKDLASPGSYKPFRLSYTPNNDDFPNSYTFRAVDTNQTVNVSQISPSSIAINFSVTAVDRYKVYNDTVTFSGQMAFSR